MSTRPPERRWALILRQWDGKGPLCIRKTSSCAWKYIRPVEHVLSLMKKAGLTPKLKKCFYFSSKIDFLVHEISVVKLQVSYRTTHAIKWLSQSKEVSRMRSFLGLCNVSQRLILNFARPAWPLDQRWKKGELTRLKLIDCGKVACDRLKKMLTSNSVLALPRSTSQLTIDVDACNYQVSCVLLQKPVDETMK